MRRFLKNLGATVASVAILGMGTASANSISNTGPWSYNKISSNSYSKHYTTNFNFVAVNNANHQYAHTGKAVVYGNTFGGSATSGGAYNYNSPSTWVNIRN